VLAELSTKYVIGVNLLDILALAILHNKRQRNATNNEVRTSSYVYIQNCTTITRLLKTPYINTKICNDPAPRKLKHVI